MKILDKINNLSTKRIVIVLFLIGFLVYSPSLFNQFIWDDEEQIVKNPLVQNWQNLGLIFRSSTFYGGGGQTTGWFFRPVMTLSYLINWNLGHGSPIVFHFFQVLLHLVNTSLFYLLLKKITKANLVSFLVALIFVLHPGITEAVVYVAATQEVLMTFFGLLVFYFLENQKKLWLPCLFLLLSLLSKESALILFPLSYLFSYLFVKKNLGKWFLLSSLIFLVYFFWRLAIANIPFGSVNVGPVAEASLAVRLTSLPYAFVSYLRIIFFPKDLFISQHFLVANIFDYRFWANGLILLFFILTTIFYFKKTKDFAFFFFSFWFLGSLTLVLNLIPLDMIVAERWLYFPFLGFLGMLGVVLGRNLKGVMVILLFLCLPLLGLRTLVRISDWQNGLKLYNHDLRLNPEAFDLLNNTGVEEFRQGNIDRAQNLFQRSINSYPKWWFAYNNLGAVKERKGDKAGAEENYRQSIERGHYYLAYENLANLLVAQDKNQEAVVLINQALKYFPDNLSLRSSLAKAYQPLGKNK